MRPGQVERRAHDRDWPWVRVTAPQCLQFVPPIETTSDRVEPERLADALLVPRRWGERKLV